MWMQAERTGGRKERKVESQNEVCGRGIVKHKNTKSEVTKNQFFIKNNIPFLIYNCALKEVETGIETRRCVVAVVCV